jgi:hypothetical protein
VPNVRFLAGPILLATALVSLASPCFAQARPSWGAVITDRDRNRLRNWRVQWVAAITRARANGTGLRIDAEGDLLKPDATLEGEPAPDGLYRCRLVKVGAQGPGIPQFLTQEGMHCRIDGGNLMVLDGPQRPNGKLYRLDDARQLFLGAMTLGDEENIMRYHRDPDRNILGIFERFGPRKWRLAMPAPRWQTMLDVLELEPENAR